ncbi:MAG: hypothetical protein K2N51_10070 [Lachnospiraceae bacterium]|nr:hypothetical protein [Lachnospiraceae bacterium]
MTKRSLCITTLLAMLIIVSGTIGLPFLYSIFVDVPSIIDEQTALPEELRTEPKRFMESLQFPLFEETRQLSKIEIESYKADSRYGFGERDQDISEMTEVSNQPGQSFYGRLFELAGFAYEESYWNTLSVVKDSPEYYILDTEMKKDNTIYSLSIAMKNYLPILLYCENQSKPSAQELKTAEEVLKKYADTEDSYLQSYLHKIDQFYKGCTEYRNQINGLYYTLLPKNKKEEGNKRDVSLLDCCSYGKWQVYSDNKTAALVYIMEKSYFVLYYDAVEQSFCGFRNGIE